MALKNQRLSILLIFILALPSGNAFSAEIPEKPPREAPDPLGQFLENEYIKDKLSIFAETQYYSWENKDDSSIKGSQSVTPITLTYRHKNFDLGLRRAYIFSENETPGSSGKVSTWSDIALTAAYTFKNLEWPVRISLDYNAPNGKATLGLEEKNAIMDSFLVQQTQFGEGKNITPGISVTKAVTDKDVFGFGISYSKKGKYDPNNNVQNDVVNPGNETIATLQWQHDERNWMIIGGLIATRYGTTQRNDIDYYRKGNRYDLNLTTLYALPWELTQGQQLMLNLRYVMQNKDRNIDFAANTLKKEIQDSNPNTLYLAIDWSKNWNRRHTVHLLFDSLKSKSNDYESTDASYDAGKSKHSYGIGYDYTINNRSNLSIRAKRFIVVDKSEANGVSDDKYRGNNVALNFNYNF